MSTPQPFHVDVPQADLDDLAGRLALTRWPDELPGAGWDYGVARDRVRQVAAYWRQGYDWYAWAARLNAIPQFTTVIDGQRVHSNWPDPASGGKPSTAWPPRLTSFQHAHGNTAVAA